MSFRIEIKEGHDHSSYFWFRPVIITEGKDYWEDNVNELEEEISIEEENEFDDEEILTTFSAKANLILRRLEETGWIELAIDPDNSEEFIILPSYSIIQIESLFNIVILSVNATFCSLLSIVIVFSFASELLLSSTLVF